MYATTTDKNIFRFPVKVYKDENGLYPSGCTQRLDCNKVEKAGQPFELTLDIETQGVNGCSERIWPSQMMGISAVINHVTVQPINVKGRGLIYIYPTDFAQLMNNCSGCCGPIVS